MRLKIISLLGSLGGRVNGDLIRGSEESMANAIVWDTHDKLPFALPFQDMKPTMCLGVLSILRGKPLYCSQEFLVYMEVSLYRETSTFIISDVSVL